MAQVLKDRLMGLATILIIFGFPLLMGLLTVIFP